MNVSVRGAVMLFVCLTGGGLIAQQTPAPAAPPPAGAQAQGPPPGPGGPGRGGRGRGIQIQEGEECPPGTTEVRPRTCQAPSMPPPSIVDYRPRSTLVTAEHKVPKAKFPAIDYHGHPGQLLSSADGVASMIASLDSLNVRLIVSADNMSGERLQRALDTVRGTPYKDRVRILAGIDFRNVGPGWAEKAIQQLEADVKAGAVGVGEISKSLGLSIMKADGTRLKIDDPDLDPIWDACARLNLPVFIHTADPQEFFEPIDYTNERWLELSLFAERRYPADRFPRFEELMAERDRLFKKHPKTRFVAAHMAWYANDLARLSKLLDELPNVSTEVGAVLYDIGRQPRAAREFFIKYQDRLLFGKDAFQPEEYPYYWRVFETTDEYFDYYRDYHAFWKLYGIDLPDQVLKKLYYQNALKLTPGLPQTGWPK
jgi:predicted TIM-barrel fold metal-dependent hydrolase